MCVQLWLNVFSLGESIGSSGGMSGASPIIGADPKVIQLQTVQ